MKSIEKETKIKFLNPERIFLEDEESHDIHLEIEMREGKDIYNKTAIFIAYVGGEDENKARYAVLSIYDVECTTKEVKLEHDDLLKVFAEEISKDLITKIIITDSMLESNMEMLFESEEKVEDDLEVC